MKTSYEGCNKEIAESLKCGEHIPCSISLGTQKEKVLIISYSLNTKLKAPYVGENGERYVNPIPIKTETYVIGAIEMMKGLVERGYAVDRQGWWINENSVNMTPSAWQYCDKPEFLRYDWEDWMLEEREVD